MIDTRPHILKRVSELQPGDVVLTWEDDGFPWTGEVEWVEKSPRVTYAGEVQHRYTIRYTHGEVSYDREDVLVKVASGVAAEHGPDAVSWFARGSWPRCICGLDPHDNGTLNAHWAEYGFRVVDDHGQLIREPI